MIKLNLKDNRYSFIEITKFIFSIWILNGHGLFYSTINRSGQIYCVAVAYFFIVSSLFILKKIDNTNHKNPLKFAIKRIWDIDGIPIILISILNVIAYFINGNYLDLSRITHFLWYIDALFLMYIYVFALRKYIKKEKLFITVIIFSSLIGFIFYYLTVKIPGLNEMCEAIGCFSLGILISYIPKIKIDNFFKRLISLLIILVLFSSLIPIALYGSIYNKPLYYLVVFFIFVPLVYFSTIIDFKNKYINILGMLSLPIYIYQELSWFLKEQHLINNVLIIYWLPIFIAIIETTIKIFKHKSN